jgi:hypothetical protein
MKLTHNEARELVNEMGERVSKLMEADLSDVRLREDAVLSTLLDNVEDALSELEFAMDVHADKKENTK